jgi:hypothetical protein
MRLSILASALLAAALVASSACRSDTADDTVMPDGTGSNGAVKIQDVQNDAMPPGTAVTLKGVVVTAIDNFGDKKGDIWVEEPEGGAFSGVHVYNAPTNTVATLAPGDIVDITGAEKSEFALSSDTSGRTVTELEPITGGQMTVTKTGTGTVPAAATVDALAIGQMADPARSAEWEKWEGVLITVTNVSALNAPKQVSGSMPDATLQNFGITGDAKLESSLAAFPTMIARNDCLGSVTGVVDYFFDYLILPRATAEVTTGGSGCPAAETLCTDTTDNDGNGFADCADNSCVVNEATCRDATITISALDTATTLPTGGLEIGAVQTVCVTAIGRNNQDFWVAVGPGSAGPNGGLYVYGQGSAIPGGMTAGTKVNVIGTVDSFNNDTMGLGLLELKELATTTSAGACAVAPVTNQTAANLTQDLMGKPMIGSLVTLTDVKVTALGNSGNHGAGAMVQGGTTFEYQSDILASYLAAGELNKCYATITGIWTYDVYTNAYSLQPLLPGTGTGTCT